MDVHGYICKLLIKTDSSKKEPLLENILSEKKIGLCAIYLHVLIP